jgi:hypothetical protein
MTLCHKKSRPLSREDKTYRDDRLFIIATEDTHAPDQYFSIFINTRIHVKVLTTKNGLSSPEHVFHRLDNFRNEYEMMEEDELWLMLDTDHWVEPNHIANFISVCTQAIQKGYQLAHSNPCFEIWLLLHVADLNENDQFTKCYEVERRLREILRSYNKRNITNSQFPIESIVLAVERAERLDRSPDDRWPQNIGSHVYKVVKKLLPS